MAKFSKDDYRLIGEALDAHISTKKASGGALTNEDIAKLGKLILIRKDVKDAENAPPRTRKPKATTA